MNDSLGTIKLSKLKRIIKKLEAYYKETDKDLSAEFLIPSLFPQLGKNFQNNIKEYYTKGYIAGQSDKYKNFQPSKILEVKELSKQINELLKINEQKIKDQESADYSMLSDEQIANEVAIEDNLLKWISDGIFLTSKISENVAEES